MAKRSRWQPPYPDPAKQATRDQQAKKVEKAVKQALITYVTCAAPKCTNKADQDSPANLPLCSGHARDVVDAFPHHCRPCEARREMHQREHEELERKRAEKAAKREADPWAKEGTIYYASIGDEIKIGWTSSIYRRMRAYPPSAQLLAIEPGTKTIERARHQQFNEYLAHGREWFKSGKFLLEHIDRMIAKHGTPPQITTLSTPERASLPGTVGVRGRSHRRHEHDGSAAVKRATA